MKKEAIILETTRDPKTGAIVNVEIKLDGAFSPIEVIGCLGLCQAVAANNDTTYQKTGG